MEEMAEQQNQLSSEPQKRKRIEWIDVAKFLGIVLVFVAHGVYLDEPTLFRSLYRGIIYTFHMPLFFILSMITTSLSDSKETYIKKTKKRAVHLLIPFAIMWVIYTFVDIFYLKANAEDINWWIQNINRLFGVEYPEVLAAGPAWFLMALFVGQSIFDFLHLVLKKDSYLFIVVCILTLIGVALGFVPIKFPFTLDMTMSSLVFFYFGYKLKSFDFEKNQFRRFMFFLAIWVITLLLTFPDFHNPTYYEVWYRRYPLFPICIFCAISGTMVYLYLVKWFCKIPYLYKPFAFLGRWTLIMVLVHSLDQAYFGYWFNFFPERFHLTDYLGGAIGLGMSVIIIFIIILIKKWLKNKHQTTSDKTA